MRWKPMITHLHIGEVPRATYQEKKIFLIATFVLHMSHLMTSWVKRDFAGGPKFQKMTMPNDVQVQQFSSPSQAQVRMALHKRHFHFLTRMTFFFVKLPLKLCHEKKNK